MSVLLKITNAKKMIEIVSILLLLLISGLNASEDIECGSHQHPVTLTNYTGIIRSPGFITQNSYDSGLECVWNIRSEERYNIHLTFNEVDLDETSGCSGDSIRILIKHGSIKQICGKRKPNDIVVHSPQVLIIFKSDYLYSGKGFSLTYKFTTKTTICTSDNVQCRNRNCVPFNKLCDGKDDCGDDSDESKCRRVNREHEFPCGQTPILPQLNHGLRVVGGSAAVEGSWPWQVDIQLDVYEPNGHHCGGALINGEYVITAGHCLMRYPHKDNFRIVLGNYGKFKPTGYEQVRYIKKYVIYPRILDGMNDDESEELESLFDIRHDIALIRLSSPVMITERVQPVCLPPKELELNIDTECFATGWGMTRGTGSSDVLKQLRMFVENSTQCTLNQPEDVEYPNSKLCMSSRQLEQGLCAGDSGGPLVHQRDGKWYLIGIISHLSTSSLAGPICGLGSGESFAKVSHKIDWIEQTLSELQQMD